MKSLIIVGILVVGSIANAFDMEEQFEFTINQDIPLAANLVDGEIEARETNIFKRGTISVENLYQFLLKKETSVCSIAQNIIEAKYHPNIFAKSNEGILYIKKGTKLKGLNTSGSRELYYPSPYNLFIEDKFTTYLYASEEDFKEDKSSYIAFVSCAVNRQRVEDMQTDFTVNLSNEEMEEVKSILGPSISLKLLN